MSHRTTLGLVAVIAALGAFIYFFERDTTSSGELESRDGRFVSAFARDRLERVIVVRGRETIEITRTANDAGVETFAMVKPVASDVDEDAIEALVSGIEWAETVREVGPASAAERARFGLDRPRVRATLVLGSTRIELAFGAEEPTGRGVYATTSENANVVVVVGKDVFESLDKESSAYRVRRLAPADLGEATRIVVRTPSGVHAAIADDGVWWTEGDVRMRASSERVGTLLTAFRELTAVRFASASVTDAQSGLASPTATLELAFGARRLLLVVGGPCDGGRHARLDRGPVACIADETVVALTPTEDALRDLRIVSAGNDVVKSATLTDGTRTLAITENEGAFRYRLTGDGPEQAGDADVEAVAELLDSLRALVAVRVEPRATSATRVFGTKLTIARREGGSDVVELSLTGGEPLARRGDESVVLVLPPEAVQKLVPAALPLMRRGLLHVAPEHIVDVTIVRGGVRETVSPAETPGTFAISSPVSVPADPIRTADLFVRLSSLEAVRFVTQNPLPEHGLSGPAATTVIIRLDEDDGHGHGGGASSHTLVVGAATELGAFARLDDGPVFVMVSATTELIAKPLVARTLLTTPAIYVDGVEITGAQTLSVRRQANALVSDAGPLAPARATALLDAIADFDAVDVAAYGVPADSGLARPRARITIVRASEGPSPARYVVLVGADIEGGRTHVRREDLAIDLLVRTETVSALLGATVAPR